MFQEKSIWQKIIDLNEQAVKEKGFQWRYGKEENWINDFIGELGELANDIKHSHNRGTKKQTIDLFILMEEFFDIYVYMVLGFESFFGNEKDFNRVAEAKLNEIAKRLNI